MHTIYEDVYIRNANVLKTFKDIPNEWLKMFETFLVDVLSARILPNNWKHFSSLFRIVSIKF